VESSYITFEIMEVLDLISLILVIYAPMKFKRQEFEQKDNMKSKKKDNYSIAL
jgi:hypothetical protein